MSAAVRPAPATASAPQPTGQIEVEHFDFWYGKTQALYDINLSIAPRAVTAFIGPSGCGKSTFLRSINRLNELIPGARRSGTRSRIGCVRAPSAFRGGSSSASASPARSPWSPT